MLLSLVIQAKALEAEVINLRKEIEITRNQHKLVDKQKLKAIQVKCRVRRVFSRQAFCQEKKLRSTGKSSRPVYKPI